MSDSTATASAANTKMNHQSLINQSQVYYWAHPERRFFKRYLFVKITHDRYEYTNFMLKLEVLIAAVY